MCVLGGGGRKTKRCLNAGRAAELGDGTDSGAGRTDPAPPSVPAGRRIATFIPGAASSGPGRASRPDPGRVEPPARIKTCSVYGAAAG